MIFVDTGAWVAVELRSEKAHAAAMVCLKELSAGTHGVLVTSDYILDKALTLVRLRAGLETAESVARRAMESESVKVAYVSQDAFKAAWYLMRKHRDKKWSFTDCTSFVLMKELGIELAFAFDRNFRQAGFKVVPE